MDQVVNILFIEDSEEDHLLMLRHLSKGKRAFRNTRVKTINELIEALSAEVFDIFLLDYDIPGHTIDQFLKALTDFNSNIPIVVVSGTMIEDQVATALQYGARDYVMKDNLRRLSNTVFKEVDAYRDRIRFDESVLENERIQGALISSEKKFQTLVENSSDIFKMISSDGKILYVSPAVKDILNFNPDELINHTIFEFIHPDDVIRINNEFKINLGIPGLNQSIRYRFRHNDGTYRYLESRTNNQLDDPDINSIIVNSRDITQRLEAEELVTQHRNAQEKLYKSTFGYLKLDSDQSIFEYVAQTMTELVPGAIISVNKIDQNSGTITVKTLLGFERFTSYLPDIIKRITTTNTFKPTAEALKILRQSSLVQVQGGLYELLFGRFPKQICDFVEKKTGISEILTMGFVSDNQLLGNAVIIVLKDTPVFNNQIIETFINVASVAIQNRLTDKQIRDSLREKEVLLKEIHHRVKNNLQIISSLLELQAIQIQDRETKILFQESQSRVKSMALVHERIYQSDDLSSINYKEYITELADFLFYSYNLPFVKYTIESEEVRMSIDSAIPCGIIINELISNALKHAFPNNRHGNIVISLKKNNKLIELAVADDGVGMKSDIDIKKSKSLGLELINALVQQLQGNIVLDTSGGTKFTVSIPAN